MITYGTHGVYFLMGVVSTIVVVDMILMVVAAVLKRKTKNT